MSALTKLAGQIVAGAILVATGTELSDIPYPGGGTLALDPNQATVATILVVVVTINAVNFIDGLDGLAAGIVAIAAVSYFVYYYSMTNILSIGSLASPALASAVLVGMCLGFLPHNFYPARVFMGDTGAMLLGLLLAYAPISGINLLNPGAQTSQVNRFPMIMPILLPAALLVIPYADLVLAVVRRTRAGTSPFAADRKHLHHRLLDIGHSQRTSVLIMYLWAALFSGGVVWLSTERTQLPGASNHHGNPLLVFVAITIAAVVMLLLISMPQLRFWNRGRQPADVVATARSPGQPTVAAATVSAAPAPVITGPATVGSATAGPATAGPATAGPATAGPAPAAAPLPAAAVRNGHPEPEPAPSAHPRSVVGYVPPAVALAASRPEALPRDGRVTALPREARATALAREAVQDGNGSDHEGLPAAANQPSGPPV
jgi:UDP-GlcNAc:undecaprenyl-phosphate/decaprenyl-phosphate GlcNAc-1-phosphate transferase